MAKLLPQVQINQEKRNITKSNNIVDIAKSHNPTQPVVLMGWVGLNFFFLSVSWVGCESANSQIRLA